MLLLNLIQVTESISGSVVPLAIMFVSVFVFVTRFYIAPSAVLGQKQTESAKLFHSYSWLLSKLCKTYLARSSFNYIYVCVFFSQKQLTNKLIKSIDMSDIASRTLYFPHIPMLSIYIAIEIKTAIWYHPFLWSTVRRVQDKRVSKSLSQIYSTSKSVKLWLSVYGGLLLALVPKFDLFRSISIFLDFVGAMWHELGDARWVSLVAGVSGAGLPPLVRPRREPRRPRTWQSPWWRQAPHWRRGTPPGSLCPNFPSKFSLLKIYFWQQASNGR